MPHLALVPFTGFRVHRRRLFELGMKLPGLAERGAAIGRLPALGLLTLAGMTPESWQISYHEAGNGKDAELLDHLCSTRPALVALSALTASIEQAYAFSAALRNAGVSTVLGGLHATALPEEARRHVDAVVIGEGEPVWQQVLQDAERGELRPVYRASAPFDLSQAPLPRYDLLGSGARPRHTLQTQRGCPLACEFCAASRQLGRFREKPLDRIEQELEALAAFRPRPIIELADDNTFAGTRNPRPLFEAMARRGVRYFTECDWRIGERPEVLRGLADSGCVQVLVGVESVDPSYRGMGVKEAPIERIQNALIAIQEAGVAVIGCFVLGADGQDRAGIDRTVRFILDSPLADVQMTLQTPFPGSGLYRRLCREGRLLPESPWSAYTLFDVTYRPDRLSVEELQDAYEEAIRAIHGLSETRRRQEIRRKIHERYRENAS